MVGAVGQLTPRQLEVLELIAEGQTNKEIGQSLGIAAGTVKTHVAAVMDALGVANRTEAASFLHREGLSTSGRGMTPEVPGFGGRPAIAVLPFEIRARIEDAEFLAEGLADDLVTRLGRWKWFPVISTSSTRRFRGHTLDLREIGRDLGARYLIEGSVRASAEELRLAIRVIDANDGMVTWASEFGRSRSDLFTAQDEIVDSIVASLEPALLKIRGIRAFEPTTEDPDAWASFERAFAYVWDDGGAGLDRAIEHFEAAIEAAPGFLSAYSGLAFAHFHRYLLGRAPDADRIPMLVDSLAEEVRRIDAFDAFSFMTAGLSHLISRRGPEAVDAFDAAVEASPSLAWAHAFRAVALVLAGRSAEGTVAIDVALRLSPEDPMKYYMLSIKGVTYTTQNRFVDAAPLFEASIDLLPDAPHAYILLAGCRVVAGDLRGARELGRKMRERDPEFDPDWTLQILVPEIWRLPARGMLKLVGVGPPVRKA